MTDTQRSEQVCTIQQNAGQGFMGRATRPKSIREVLEILLVDRFQQHRHRTLHHFVLYGGHSNRSSFLPVAFRDMHPFDGKWLHAGVLERGQLSYPEHGTPQGGVISPLLANSYLHYVLDCWYVESVKPRMKG